MDKRKGSLTIEAAIVLPIFLFALFALIYIIKIVYIHEQVQMAIEEAANEMAIGAYLLEHGGLLNLQQQAYQGAKANVEVSAEALQTVMNTLDGLAEFDAGFVKDINTVESDSNEKGGSVCEKLDNLSKDFLTIKDQIEREVTDVYGGLTEIVEAIEFLAEDSRQIIVSLGVMPGMEVMNNAIGSKIASHLVNSSISDADYQKWHIINGKKGMDYSRSTFFLNDDDLYIVVSYEVQIPFLKGVIKPLHITQSVKTRAYIGNGNFVAKLEKSKLSEENEDIVYVTKKGTKYHSNRSCRYIDVKLKETMYSNVKGKEAICEVCAKKGIDLCEDTMVFSTDASEIFHTSKGCWTVSREVITITKDEALEHGYALCSKCKEGEGK